MVLIERCRTCKNNWDGHCIAGNDIWKMKNSNKEVECEEYEMYKNKPASFLQAQKGSKKV